MAPQNADIKSSRNVEISNNDDDIVEDGDLQFGKFLSNPEKGEEVVISGLAGQFPDSDNVNHFRDNLLNKVDMVSGDTRRWNHTHPEIPIRAGKLNRVTKFDPGYFGIHYRQAHAMDPMARSFLESAIESIFDAGLNPDDLAGTNCGVFVGACFAESERQWFFDQLIPKYFAMTGCERSMIANRVSYFLKLNGPSFVCDTACSSSMFALDQAYRAIRCGHVDSAIVGGTNFCLHPFVSLQFARLGVLCLDGRCKCFDAEANGYARSEAVCAIFLQKSKDAKRIFCQVVHSKTNCDGYKEQGITYPSGDMQKRLLVSFYNECGINPADISFVEAHGTGTKVGDPEEAAAIDEVFCKGRNKPLLMGSVKSSIGHSEPSSGLCSITKAIIGFETGTIPPNLHYKRAREGIAALEQGRLKVITEKTQFEDDNGLIAVNSFGFGGGNCHVLLRWNPKEKLNNGLPRDDLPRLVCVSGRVEESIHCLLDDVSSRVLDAEYVGLLQNIFRNNVRGHLYRGYSLVTKNGEITRSWNKCNEETRKLYFAFGGVDNYWQKIGSDLLIIPIFAAAIQRIHNVLSKWNINITEILSTKNPSVSISSSILGSLSVQIGIADIMKTIELTPTGVFGHSTGLLACAYFDGSLSLEETMMSALVISNAFRSNNEHAANYVVQINENEIDDLPKGVEVTGILNANEVLISGNLDVLDPYVKELSNRGTKVTDVGISEISLRKQNIEKFKPQLVQQLKKIITKPKPPNGKWVISSEDRLISAEYFVNSLISPSNFSDLVRQIATSSIVLEVGSGQFTNIIQSSFINKEILSICLDQQTHQDNTMRLLDALGRAYNFGYNFHLDRVYPKVQFPVSRGTPMISSLIKWDHSDNWTVFCYSPQMSVKAGARTISVAPGADDWKFVTGHVIDGRNLFPAAAYINLVWETFALISDSMTADMHVIFENVKFNRATHMSRSNDFTIMIQRGTGNFEVIEADYPVVTGRITNAADGNERLAQLEVLPDAESDKIKMTTKDIYKDLKLRGYNYTGEFRSLLECDLGTKKALVKWNSNWITFIDNMFQLKILQIDSRLLYVPTGFDKLTIDGKRHIQYVQKFADAPGVPVYAFEQCNIIKSGGIEVRGLKANSIPRRKPRGEPVLEKYTFIPNEADLNLKESIRVNVQIFLENVGGFKVKAVEIIDEVTRENAEPLAPLILEVLGDLPLIQPNISIFTKKEMKLDNITVEDKKLVAETDCTMVVATNVLSRAQVLQHSFSALKSNGFILSREDHNFDISKINTTGIHIVTIHKCEEETLVVIKKPADYQRPVVIDVTDSNYEFAWLPSLQDAVKKDGNVIVLAQNDPLNGAIGLVNCLRREPGGNNIRCFFILDNSAPKFDVDDPVYSDQVQKHLAINVFKNGKWGTYRHLLLDNIDEVEVEHGYVNITVKGDLSSFRWVEGPLTLKSVLPEEKVLISVYYASLNFRDIMTASGKISADVITLDRSKQECVQGFEYSGRTLDGRRVMGMHISGACASLVCADSYLVFDVPDYWTLEQAATVPVVYTTTYFALVLTAQIRRGQTILIHSGAGGIGQSAINVALYYGCKVFTTVGSPEKREFLKKQFPQLKDRQIGNSHDTSFEEMIHRETNGRGVDVVLNSLAEEKLFASVRCLARGGMFLEIGKFDMATNNSLKLQLMEKEASFSGVMLDIIFFASPAHKKKVAKLMLDGVKTGAVRPLNTHLFKAEEVEQAHRFMAAGKHMGKVVVCVKREEVAKVVPPKAHLIKCMPRYIPNEEQTYIICGGLGGFGLELADWLVMRGARNLVLTSRTGVKTGYQASRIRIWETYGTRMHVSTADITTKSGCEQLLKEANELGPVAGIFNLAVVLRDALLENQTIENYQTSFAPKALATKYLDEVSRKLCPQLRDFVIFSSVSCGRGNPGQTNYGMANSVMERICEKRRADGLPALAIEWGAVGDVGLVAEMQEHHTELEIGGTLQQRITSCTKVLDVLLKQKNAIVSSMVVAEKRAGAGGVDNIVNTVANILGLGDLKTVSLHATLAELGMDSITAVEIKQTLEREFEVFLTAQDIRSMTFSRLQDIETERDSEENSDNKKEKLPSGIELILRLMGDEASCNVPMIRLPSKIKENDPAPSILLFPGLEGVASILKPLAINLNCHALTMQFCHDEPEDSLRATAEYLLPHVEKYISKNQPFKMVAYSFGTVFAMETVGLLEQKGYAGTLILVDGSPKMLYEVMKQQVIIDSEDQFQTSVLCALMSLYMPYETILNAREKIFRCNTFEERMQVAKEAAPKDTPHSYAYQRSMAINVYKKLKGLAKYQPTFEKLKSTVKLFRPQVPSMQGLPDDYGLSELCAQPVEVTIFSGNHITILENTEMADAINVEVGAQPLYAKESIIKDEAAKINLREIEVRQI